MIGKFWSDNCNPFAGKLLTDNLCSETSDRTLLVETSGRQQIGYATDAEPGSAVCCLYVQHPQHNWDG